MTSSIKARTVFFLLLQFINTGCFQGFITHIHTYSMRQSLHSHLLPPCLNVKQFLNQRNGPYNTLGGKSVFSKDFQQNALLEIQENDF